MVDEGALKDAATKYARFIRAKRSLLQTLFYASRNSGDEAWPRYRRIERAEQSAEQAASRSAEWKDEKEAFEHAARDAAMALMLVLDYTRRGAFDSDALDKEVRSLGYKLQRVDLGEEPVELNRMIWALGNQARHLYEWKKRSEDELKCNPSVRVIKRLGFGPHDANAARELIGRYGIVQSYLDFEDMLLRTVRDVQERGSP